MCGVVGGVEVFGRLPSDRRPPTTFVVCRIGREGRQGGEAEQRVQGGGGGSRAMNETAGSVSLGSRALAIVNILYIIDHPHHP